MLKISLLFKFKINIRKLNNFKKIFFFKKFKNLLKFIFLKQKTKIFFQYLNIKKKTNLITLLKSPFHYKIAKNNISNQFVYINITFFKKPNKIYNVNFNKINLLQQNIFLTKKKISFYKIY